MKLALFAVALLGTASIALVGLVPARPPSPPSFAVNWMRVLSDRVDDVPVELDPGTRLTLPASLAEDVWSFLVSQQPRRHRVEVDQITDWPYDTPGHLLAEQWISVRLRTGSVRTKLQVKAYDRESGHATELTFAVTDSAPRPLETLLLERDRASFEQLLRVLGVEPGRLSPSGPVHHARRRVALTRAGTTVLASLDHLTWDGGEHHVLELTPGAANDGPAAHTLARELRAVFPVVRFDPTPKLLAVRQRSVPRDHASCVWPAARLMCRPAPPPEPTPVPSFLPPVPPLAEQQAIPNFEAVLSPTGMVSPLGTGLGGRSYTGGFRTLRAIRSSTPVY
jgi:hypothetical protein